MDFLIVFSNNMINSFLLMDESILINIITVCAFLSINTINFFYFRLNSFFI